MRSLFKRTAATAAVGALGVVAGCKQATSVQDLNNVPSTVISGGLTPTTFQLLVTGVLASDRANNSFAFTIYGETLGRDVYNIDPSESRYITELLGSPIDPSAFTGGGAYTGNFQTIRTANTVIDNLGSLSSNYSAGQLAATRGLLRTLKAQGYYRILALRGSNGVAIAVNQDITAAPAPILCEQSALAAVSALLDTAETDFAAAASASPAVTAFPFTLPAGFSSNGTFNTVAGFRAFARAFQGKVEVYRGIKAGTTAGAANFTKALADFTGANALVPTYASATSDLNIGPYYVYGTQAGDLTNPLAAGTIFLNPDVRVNTLNNGKAGFDTLQTGDARGSKITTLSAARTRSGTSTLYGQTVFSTANQTTPFPILRNAEVILLRAQANIGLGNLAAAATDINAVRTREGGLPAIATPASTDAAVSAVLYEKRFSLLLQGPQRLQDLRSYGRLNSTYYPVARTGDTFQTQLPTPISEVNARGAAGAACTGS